MKAAEAYFAGLAQARKRNMERIAEVVPDADDQRLQHFVSYSPWDHREVIDHVARDADRLLGGSPNTCLIVDESGFPKKGDRSVGVARQWCGRLGKVENCQVGVFAALARDGEVTLTDARLYLPKAWAEDSARCKRAKVPEAERGYRTKPELALEMVRHARRLGVEFAWVGADSFYGADPKFLRGLDADGEVFVVDVKASQRIYLEDPRPQVPPRRSARGRAPQRPRAQGPEPIRVDAWVRNQPGEAWRRLSYRDSTKGPLWVEVLHRRVWVWDGRESKAHCWHLIVRRSVRNPGEIKYTLSNAPEQTSVRRLAYMQGQRYWVERSLQEAKSEVGMAEYQVRLWQGWHHHMAMVLMALLFLLEARRKHRGAFPLLSARDVREVLSVLLPRANATLEDALAQMARRHRRRASAMASHTRKANQSQAL
nr:IS701 family transposase [Deferrisoma camini]